MYQFFRENQVLVVELARLQELLLDETRPFHFSRDQWYSRFSLVGKERIKCTPAERIAMHDVLMKVRAEMVCENVYDSAHARNNKETEL